MSVAGDAHLDRKNGKASPGKDTNGKDAVWRGFINVNLTEGQKEQYEDWFKTGEAWDVLAELVGSGCHVAVKLDPGGGGFMASITQRNPLHVNAGLCITARSREAYKALFRAIYLAVVLGVDADWSVGQTPADPDRW